MYSPRAGSLFHFTKNLDALKSILKDGFWPRYCLEDIRWQNFDQFEYVAFPMVCFCDIPIGRIVQHVEFYGSYGIGVTKEWGLKNKLNPIVYLSGPEPLGGAFNALSNVVFSHPDKKQVETGLEHFRHLVAHTKPISGKMMVSGKEIDKEFYAESEWRFVPRQTGVEAFLKYDEFDSMRHEYDKVTWRDCLIKLSGVDIRYIFVPSDGDIPDVIKFLQAELDHFSSRELNILMSRVTSLEAIKSDF
ncbi:MAG: hypothetical protein RLZZ399_2176 [Verrucomicrobiota bacterium]|jgi:hypothetical protein